MNTGMLNDETFKTTVAVDLKEFLDHNDNGEVNPAILWDTAKAFLRGKIIARMSLLKKLRSKKLLDLQDRLREMEQLHSSTQDTSTLSQMNNIKQEIDNIYSEEIERKVRYTKQRHYEAGPRAVKLLAWRLRKQQAENTI